MCYNKIWRKKKNSFFLKFSPIRSSVVKSSVLFEVQSFEVGSFKVGSFEVGSFEVGSFEVGSFEVQSYEVRSFEVQSFEVQSVNPFRPYLHPAHIKATNPNMLFNCAKCTHSYQYNNDNLIKQMPILQTQPRIPPSRRLHIKIIHLHLNNH